MRRLFTIFSCNIAKFLLAFFLLALPFFFLDALYDNIFNLLRFSLNFWFASNVLPSLNITNDLTPVSNPIHLFLSMGSKFGNLTPVSTKILAKYFPVGVLDIVIVFIFPLNFLDNLIGISLQIKEVQDQAMAHHHHNCPGDIDLEKTACYGEG